MLGGSVAGFSNKLKGSWRAYLEATDTSAGSFKGRDRNNIVYNHGSLYGRISLPGCINGTRD